MLKASSALVGFLLPPQPALAQDAGVTISPTALTIEKGSSKTYTVSPDAPPSPAAPPLTVTVSGESGGVTVRGNPLTFTSDNYSIPQTVTVNVAANAANTGETPVRLVHNSAGGGDEYGGISIEPVLVTVIDPTPNPTPTPTLQLRTNPVPVTEGNDIRLVVASSRPRTGSLPVRLTLAARSSSSFDADDIPGTLGPRDFTAEFGTSNNSTAIVTIPTSTDNEQEGAEAYQITLEDRAGYVVGRDSTADGTLNDGNSAPAAPTGLTARAGNAKVILSWTKPTGPITSYKLLYGKTSNKASATWASIPSSRASTTTHTVTGLENGSEYSFKVRAVNGGGDGAATDWVTATPLHRCCPSGQSTQANSRGPIPRHPQWCYGCDRCTHHRSNSHGQQWFHWRTGHGHCGRYVGAQWHCPAHQLEHGGHRGTAMASVLPTHPTIATTNGNSRW